MTTPIFPSVIGHNLLDGGTDAQDGNRYPGPLLQEYAAAVVGAAYGEPAGVVMDNQSAASANTAAIQRALDAGGTVVITRPGTVWINDTLLIQDGGGFVLGDQTTLKQADSTNKLMIANAALFVAASSISIAWTAGSIATVTWASHGLVSGDAFVVQSAAEANWNRVYRVNTVVDTASFTIRLPFVGTASPTGTITAKKCDRNIRFSGRLDFNKTGGNSAGSGYGRMMSMWAFIADSKIDVRGVDGNKYVAMLAGFADTEVSAEADPKTNSDVLKVYGPGMNAIVRVRGSSPEDIMSVQAKEPAAFFAYMPCFGPIDGVRFDNVWGTETGNGSGAAVVYSDNDHQIDNVVISSGSLSSKNGNALKLTRGTGFTPSSSLIRKVTVERLRLASEGATRAPLHVETKVQHLVVDCCDLIPNSDTQPLLKTSSDATIDLLEIVNMQLNILDWPSTGTQFALEFTGSINKLVFSKCTFRGVQARTRLMLIGANAVKNITFDDCEFESLDQICQFATGSTNSPVIDVRGCRVKSVNSVVNSRSSCVVNLSASMFESVTNGIVRPEGAGVVVSVYGGDGCTYSSAPVIICVSSATAIPYGSNLPLDIGATGITKAAGASCFNTGTGRGTIPQNRPVVCDGTSWFNATNLSHTF